MSAGFISVEYFAGLREAAGISQENFPLTADGATPASVYLQLSSKYAFAFAITELRVAVNDEFSTMDHPLRASDKLVYIPPVAGG